MPTPIILQPEGIVSAEAFADTPPFDRVTVTPMLEGLQAFSVEFEALCSITKEPFGGTVFVVVRPHLYTVEYLSFETWVNSLRTYMDTHEGLAMKIHSTLVQQLEDVMLAVGVQVTDSVHCPAFVMVGALEEELFRVIPLIQPKLVYSELEAITGEVVTTGEEEAPDAPTS